MSRAALSQALTPLPFVGDSFALTVPGSEIAPLRPFIEDSGLKVPDVLGDLNLPQDLFESNTAKPVRLFDFFQILEHLSIAVHDETCHLSSRHLSRGSTDFVLSTAAQCTNLREAMKRVAKTYNLLHGGSFNRVESSGGDLVYVIDDGNFPYTFDKESAFSHAIMESVLIFLHGLLCHTVSEDLSAHMIRIRTKRPHRSVGDGFLDFWDAQVRCHASSYALVYAAPVGALPVRMESKDAISTAAVYDRVAAMIESREMSGGRPRTVAEQVTQLLERGLRDQPAIAAGLGMSVATLRRRLAQEGITFRHLQHRVLNDQAQGLLAQGCHVSDVAEELGFSDFRSFSRAFVTWNGVTPTAWTGRPPTA